MPHTSHRNSSSFHSPLHNRAHSRVNTHPQNSRQRQISPYSIVSPLACLFVRIDIPIRIHHPAHLPRDATNRRRHRELDTGTHQHDDEEGQVFEVILVSALRAIESVRVFGGGGLLRGRVGIGVADFGGFAVVGDEDRVVDVEEEGAGAG